MLIRNILLIVLLSSCHSLSQKHLKDGDFIFQNLDCGPLCDAIESVTEGRDNLDFSHIGFYNTDNGKEYVLESIGSGVQSSPLDSFLARSSNPHYIGRLKKKYRKLISDALDYGKQKIGVPYDPIFIYDTTSYYCSELLYDCFKRGAKDSTLFYLEPMTFQSKSDSSIQKIWQEYYKGKAENVPEGQPGINPAGMSRSEALQWLKILKK